MGGGKRWRKRLSILKSKHTQYNGYKFRSRTEARWAVFFDVLGVEYLYEHEDFEVKGRRYLPDFFLPDLMPGGCFAEVKHRFSGFERQLCVDLCEVYSVPVILLVDHPSINPTPVLIFEHGEVVEYKGVIHGAYRKSIWFEPAAYDATVLGQNYLDAVEAAREARFEFGETPRVYRNGILRA